MPPSLDPRHPFSRYQHDAWGSAEGLPQNTVGAMVRTSDGYLWLATQDGDCVMPGPSGPQLADELKSIRPNAKVLFVSGYTAHEATRKGVVRAGALVLQKPFTPGALAMLARRALDGMAAGA